ncbi:MAG: hypothetical protein LUG98_04515 [Tannerellaceae bacterium]|nr:hypothetical protein [Tannerellaceae bacterium]
MDTQKDRKAAENMSQDTSKEVRKEKDAFEKIPTENKENIQGNPDNISDPDVSSGVC